MRPQHPCNENDALLLEFFDEVFQDVSGEIELDEEGFANLRYITPYSGLEILVAAFMEEFTIHGYLQTTGNFDVELSGHLLDLLDTVWTRVPAVELEHPHWGLCFYVKRRDWQHNNKELAQNFHFKHKLNTLARVVAAPDS